MKPEIVTLTDSSQQQQAQILVSQGFNCFSWTRRENAQTVDVLWATDDFGSGQGRASSSGIPILFPFPGRLRGTELNWRGQAYPLEAGDAFGNAIHGFVHTRPWRLVEQSSDSVTAEFQASTDDRSLLQRWPSDFHLVGTYRLESGTLTFELKIANPDEKPLSFGLGLHPYFRTGIFGTPIGGETLQVPLETNWLLNDMLPTGESEPEPFGLSSGMTLGQQQLDHVFGHPPSGGQVEARLSGADDRGLTISYGPEYPYCVIYTPSHREAVCIEPYTCLPNSPEFLDSLSTTGWLELAPGESLTTRVAYLWQ